MAISKKIVTVNNKIDLISTTYSDSFNENINRSGRKSIDYNELNEEQFNRVKQNKCKYLVRKCKNYKEIYNYCELNDFNYFISVHATKKEYENLNDRLRKADRNIKFLSLACWSKGANLHYHMLVDTKLKKVQLEKKFQNLDRKIEKLRYQKGLEKYFKKNIVEDILPLLNSKDPEHKEKQIEILKYNKILSNSRNLIKPIIKKLDASTTLKEVIEAENAEYIETKEAKNKGDSKIRIDKLKIIE
jgi:hypothetical protein